MVLLNRLGMQQITQSSVVFGARVVVRCRNDDLVAWNAGFLHDSCANRVRSCPADTANV